MHQKRPFSHGLLEAIHARQREAVGNTDASKWAIRSLSRASRDNMIRLAQSEPPLSVTGDDWDSDPWSFGVKNGVVDLRTGTLRNGQPNDLITKTSPWPYLKDATAPRWIEFLHGIFEGNDDLPGYIQQVIGYALTGLTGEKCFWILWGTGSNGKTTLLEVTAAMIGRDFCWSMPFLSDKWTDAMSSYQRAELAGRRFVRTSELSGRKKLNSELVKSLTGSDSIEARRVRERPFNFVPVAKFFMAVNDPPVIDDTSNAMWSRVKLIPFLRSFEVDTTLKPALLAELPGILAWAVEGCRQWAEAGAMVHPECVTLATKEYQLDSNPFQKFIDEQCVVGPQCTTRSAALYNRFKSDGDSDFVVSQKAFTQKLIKIPGVAMSRDRNGTLLTGIGIKSERDLPMEDERGAEDGPPLSSYDGDGR